MNQDEMRHWIRRMAEAQDPADVPTEEDLVQLACLQFDLDWTDVAVNDAGRWDWLWGEAHDACMVAWDDLIMADNLEEPEVAEPPDDPYQTPHTWDPYRYE